MLKFIVLAITYATIISCPLSAADSYPPENAARASVLADVFATRLHPGMNETEVADVLKPYSKEIDNSKFHWVGALFGSVPLKLIFKEKNAPSYIILPPQTKLKGAKNYDLIIPVTIQFEKVPEFKDQEMNQAAIDFFKGKRTGRLLEFAIICELRGPIAKKVFYFGPNS
jgi:hypothetical protein